MLYPDIMRVCYLVIALTISAVQALPNVPSQVPNGRLIGCVLCHEDAQGGGSHNAFGRMVDANFFNEGRVAWGPELAGMDADGDSYSNGVELLDPSGEWQPGAADPGAATALSMPFDKASIPVQETSIIQVAWSTVKRIVAKALFTDTQ